VGLLIAKTYMSVQLQIKDRQWTRLGKVMLSPFTKWDEFANG